MAFSLVITVTCLTRRLSSPPRTDEKGLVCVCVGGWFAGVKVIDVQRVGGKKRECGSVLGEMVQRRD